MVSIVVYSLLIARHGISFSFLPLERHKFSPAENLFSLSNTMSNWKQIKNNTRLMDIYVLRLEIVKYLREFFYSEKFREVDTPIMIDLPGQEPYLYPISTIVHGVDGQEKKKYLQTSPEYAMKKLLGAGFGNIFQICKCFRDYEGESGLHNTEFTMVEWYRKDGSLSDIMDDGEKMFKFIAEKLSVSEFSYKDCKTDIFTKWDRISMKELWKQYLDVDLDQLLDVNSMSVLAKKLGYDITAEYSYEDVFYKIFLNKIEPFLGKDRPIFVYDYPSSMCSLSKQCTSDPRYSERFELYICGVEIANAFGELTELDKQKKLLEQDRNKRGQLGKDVFAIDNEFLDALDEIEQSCAGIALGVDRMVLLLTQADDIKEVIFK